jgi:hypothetical protein
MLPREIPEYVLTLTSSSAVEISESSLHHMARQYPLKKASGWPNEIIKSIVQNIL